MPRRTKPPKLLSPQQQAKFLRKQERRARTDAWLKAHPKTKIALYIGVIVFALLLCGICAGGTLAAFHGTEATASPTTQAVIQSNTTPTTDNSLPTDTPTATPTHIAIVHPTPQPTPIPTHAPQPTQKPTQPPPKPTSAPACQAVNNNPWCYNFSPGNLIYNPPSNFCDYFNCIPSFWGSDDPDNGHVVECADTTYSQSGGESGACSYHGGVMRALYSH